jgi:hypothetical protein
MDVMSAVPAAKGEKQMTTFTINAENNITAFATRKEARVSGAAAFFNRRAVCRRDQQ